MRADTATFHAANVAPTKSPRFVVGIIFDVASIYITSHTGIDSVPGVVLDGCLQQPSAMSQRIVPDEARSEIGTMSFDLVDIDSAFTDEARDKLGDGKGLRGKEVRLYVGYEGMDFVQFQRFQTQVISEVEYDDGVYRIQCRDITREQRKEIFEPKKTTLRDTVSATATTIPVYVTTDFSTVFHGASYSDAPSSTVGYIIIDKEVIRYTGKTADSFTGCTRGVLNTRAVAHEVDAGTTADRRPKVEEYIYLEMPAAKLAYAILTGVIYGDSATLPSHWHLGIDTTWVRLSDFTGIGSDLWNTSLDSEGFITRFAGLTKTDGKKFLESEVYILLGCYSPIYSDGTIGLKRMNHVLADAPYVVELNQNNCVSWSGLKHEMDRMHNHVRVDWNWDGTDYTRRKDFIDAGSISAHGEAPVKELKFKGLHGARHTDAIVQKRIDAVRDRFTRPPETMSVTVLPSLNRLEVGDIVRVRLPAVRDFAGSGAYIDRSFEIQQKTEDFWTGDVTLELFGSTGQASVDPVTSAATALPDGYYTAQGVNINTVCTVVVVGSVGVIQPGTYNLNGHADMNNASAVYYYPGDLELADGAILQVNNNTQLRVRGFFTVNGDIDGIGRGKAGVADSGGWMATQAGTPGFIGNSRGMDGVLGMPMPRGGVYIQTQACAFTQGQHSAFPYLDLTVSGTTLLGIPSDMRGTSGGAGGKIGRATAGDWTTGTVNANGGTGADSGAGLAIICRGLSVGASGSINLSGDDSAATSLSASGIGVSRPCYPGPGGAGSPGGFLLLLDGSGISIPDLSGGRFIAACGEVPVDGTPLPQRGPEGLGIMNQGGWAEPGSGYLDESYISALDLSNVAHRIQYVPETQTAAEDEEDLPPAPVSLSVSAGQHENVLIIGLPPLGSFDVIEIYAAVSNDRTGAVLVDSVGGSTYRHQLGGGVTRYYWVRSRRGGPNSDVFSAWFPNSSTGGISGATFSRFIARGNCEVIGDVARKVGGSSAWDSDVYSPDQYNNGCFVTFRADQTNSYVMVGLNSDPTTDQNYTSLDYAFELNTSGTVSIYESGVLIGTVGGHGAYTTATVFTITHDGKLIKYFKGGALVRQVPVANVTLFMDSSFYTPGARISALQFGPLSGITPSPWVARGNCVAGLTTARKSGGSSAWDSDIYSVDSYPVCHVKFKPSQANLALMIGLNTDPITDQSYGSIDYAWYAAADGNVYIYENGIQQGSGVPYTTSSELGITYDGSNVRYYIDRVVKRTVAAASLILFADASFYAPDAAVNSLHFGPGTALEAVGTPGIEQEAATDMAQSTPANGSIAWADISTGVTFFDTQDVTTVSITNNTSHTITVDVAYKGLFYLSATELSGIGRFAWLNISNGATYSEDTVGYSFSTYVTPNALLRSGSISVDIASGATVTATLKITLRAAAGVYSGGPASHWKDVSLTATAVKK
jgi:hypothetical protein